MADELDRLAGRNGQIWRDYCRGLTQQEIARRYELSQARVSEVIKQVRDSIPEQDRAEAVVEVRDFLRELRAEASRIADMDPVPVYHPRTGEILCDPTGRPVYDYAGKLRAMETAARFAEHERKLIGLDAAVKVDMSTTDQSAAERTAKEAAARLEQPEEGTENEPA